MTSESRDEILDVIQQVYWLKLVKEIQNAKSLSVYGVSISALGDFVTSEKDIKRGLSRKPTDYYLLQQDGHEKDSHKGINQSINLD